MAIDGYGVYNDFDPTLQKGLMVGYITLQEDAPPEQVKARCIRTEKFSIALANSAGVLHNCYCVKSALHDIEFPENKDSVGSGVVYFVNPYTGKAVIIGVVAKAESTLLVKTGVSSFKKQKGNNIAGVAVDEEGNINIDAEGIGANGTLNINVRNDSGTAKINIYVKGDMSLYADGSTSIKSVRGDINIEGGNTISLNANTGDIHIHNDNSNISITDSGVDIDTDKSILIGGQFNVLYSKVPEAEVIADVSEIGVSHKVKIG